MFAGPLPEGPNPPEAEIAAVVAKNEGFWEYAEAVRKWKPGEDGQYRCRLRVTFLNAHNVAAAEETTAEAFEFYKLVKVQKDPGASIEEATARFMGMAQAAMKDMVVAATAAIQGAAEAAAKITAAAGQPLADLAKSITEQRTEDMQNLNQSMKALGEANVLLRNQAGAAKSDDDFGNPIKVISFLKDLHNVLPGKKPN